MDYCAASILGSNLPKIVPVAVQKLNLKVVWIQGKYIKDLEKKFHTHGVYKKLKALEAKTFNKQNSSFAYCISVTLSVRTWYISTGLHVTSHHIDYQVSD